MFWCLDVMSCAGGRWRRRFCWQIDEVAGRRMFVRIYKVELVSVGVAGVPTELIQAQVRGSP
jgi:hypothetical protein